jgi:hypothetical protein
LPNSISIDEFELIYNEIINLDLDITFDYDISDSEKTHIANIVHRCYIIDENEVPKKYKLMRLDTIFDNYDSMVNI